MAAGPDAEVVSDIAPPNLRFFRWIVVVLTVWFVAAFSALFTGLTGGTASQLVDVGFVLLGVVLLVVGVYAAAIVTVFRRAPMVVTKDGVFLPGWASRLSRRASRGFIPFTKIADVRSNEEGGWIRIQFTTIDGSHVVSYCREVGVVRAIERFMPKGSPNGTGGGWSTPL